jgi:hypothetical protein
MFGKPTLPALLEMLMICGFLLGVLLLLLLRALWLSVDGEHDVHVRHYGGRDGMDRYHVELQQVRQILRGQFRDGSLVGLPAARIVDENVNATPLLHNGRHHALDLLRLCDVNGIREDALLVTACGGRRRGRGGCLSHHPLRRGGQLIPRPRTQGHAGSLFVTETGNGLANPTASACHQDTLSGQERRW